MDFHEKARRAKAMYERCAGAAAVGKRIDGSLEYGDLRAYSIEMPDRVMFCIGGMVWIDADNVGVKYSDAEWVRISHSMFDEPQIRGNQFGDGMTVDVGLDRPGSIILDECGQRRFNPNVETGRISGANPPIHSSREHVVKLDAKDLAPQIEKVLQEKLAPLKKAQEKALSLLRDLPTRSLDATMRARVLEVERALVEAIRPRTESDAGAPGAACAEAVAAYDD